jgi:ABC-type dipeptide/oligopeptide/nickel transport system ATPase component
MGLLDPPARVTHRTVRYRGEERRPLPGREVAMVFQDALSSLNPNRAPASPRSRSC